jgi:hypothetical protein
LNEPLVGYFAINHPNQLIPGARLSYGGTPASTVYPIAPFYKSFELPAFYNSYFDLPLVPIPNKRLNPTKAALVLKGFNKND